MIDDDDARGDDDDDDNDEDDSLVDASIIPSTVGIRDGFTQFMSKNAYHSIDTYINMRRLGGDARFINATNQFINQSINLTIHQLINQSINLSLLEATTTKIISLYKYYQTCITIRAYTNKHYPDIAMKDYQPKHRSHFYYYEYRENDSHSEGYKIHLLQHLRL